ncbi:disease resistance protein Pik-1-like [Apium graveolens]|uniref:disease resistance protein Pik-1-like n=1 Tax=Apium graveolens TaxID=4045 RepID=UPI003D7A8AF2
MKSGIQKFIICKYSSIQSLTLKKVPESRAKAPKCCFTTPTKTNNMKLAMQRVVIKVTVVDQKKSRTRAMKIAATAFGVESVALSGAEKDEIVVTGKGIDTVELARLLRKKLGSADLLSVGTVPEEKKKAEKENADYVVPLVQGSTLLSL